MESIVLTPATVDLADRIPDLIHSTGPAVFDFVFLNDRTLFDRYLIEAWKRSDTLFSHSEATVAKDGDELLGIEIGYSGTRFYALREGGAEAARAVIEAGHAT